MPRSHRKLYEDILQAISELEVFCKDKDIDHFLEDRQLQLTVERELEIIGEALSRLRREFPDHADLIPDVHKIIGLRNVLAHGYDVLDYEILWDVIINRMHILKESISEQT
jgi:uncharacterized protein with HEPN domain